MAAKVEIVFGKVNKDNMQHYMASFIEEIELWDENHTILHIEYANPLKTTIRRLLLFVHHPEH
jgi:hypothetical protein